MRRIAGALSRSLLGLPITVLLVLFFVVPMTMVLSLSVRPYDSRSLVGTEFTLENFSRFLTDATYLASFARTFWIALATTALCMVLGFPAAWYLHQVKSGTVRLGLTLIVLLPLMVSLVVASFAWVLILGNNGVLNDLLMSLGLRSSPLRLMSTITGVVIVGTFSHLSYTILTTFAALENIDPNLARAARIHGAREAQVFRHVILPLSVPGIVAGGLIVFALNMAAFVIPFLIGGGRVNVVPLLIYQFTMQLFDWPGAATLGVLLFIVTIGVTWVAAIMAQRLLSWERR